MIEGSIIIYWFERLWKTRLADSELVYSTTQIKIRRVKYIFDPWNLDLVSNLK